MQKLVKKKGYWQMKKFMENLINYSSPEVTIMVKESQNVCPVKLTGHINSE